MLGIVCIHTPVLARGGDELITDADPFFILPFKSFSPIHYGTSEQDIHKQRGLPKALFEAGADCSMFETLTTDRPVMVEGVPVNLRGKFEATLAAWRARGHEFQFIEHDRTADCDELGIALWRSWVEVEEVESVAGWRRRREQPRTAVVAVL